MRIALAMVAMLVSGLSLGGGGATLYWSGQMTKQFQAQAEWKGIADKQKAVMEKQPAAVSDCADVLKKQSATIREQGDALRNLTAASNRLIEATKLR